MNIGWGVSGNMDSQSTEWRLHFHIYKYALILWDGEEILDTLIDKCTYKNNFEPQSSTQYIRNSGLANSSCARSQLGHRALYCKLASKASDFSSNCCISTRKVIPISHPAISLQQPRQATYKRSSPSNTQKVYPIFPYVTHYPTNSRYASSIRLSLIEAHINPYSLNRQITFSQPTEFQICKQYVCPAREGLY